MSNLFEDRERGYEAKWAHDEELHFKIMSLRNARLAHWAAELMKLPPEQVDRYVQAVTAVGVTDSNAAFAKIAGDLKASGMSVPDPMIHRKMKELYVQAERELTR